MKTRIAILTTLVLLSLSHAALAQGPINFRIDRVDASAFPEVRLDLTIRDANGVPIQGLSVKNLDVAEDKVTPPLALESLESFINPEIPIAVILVIDTSGSMQSKPLADAKIAATRFVDRLGTKDRVAVLAFHDAVSLAEPFPQLDPTREVDFAADKRAAYQVVEGLSAAGSTPLYDAVFKAVRMVARQPAGNRAVLLLSDGRDEGPGGAGRGSKIANPEDGIEEANRANIPVFVVGLGKDIDRQYLTRLSLRTGGTFQETPDSAKLAELFQNVEDLLKQQYRLTYRSALQPDGRMHSVHVTVKVQDRIAFDEKEFGPLGTAPTPTSPPTATPTLTATATPTATPTPIPVAPRTTPEPPSAPPVADYLPIVIGVIALMAVGGIVIAALRRRRPKQLRVFCSNCGRELESREANCPYCGAADKFERSL